MSVRLIPIERRCVDPNQPWEAANAESAVRRGHFTGIRAPLDASRNFIEYQAKRICLSCSWQSSQMAIVIRRSAARGGISAILLVGMSSRRAAPWTVFHGHRQRRPCFAKRAQELPAFNAQRRQPSRRDAQPWTHGCANSFNCRLSQHLAGLKITQSLVSSVSLVRCEEVAEPARHERCAVSGRVADEIAVASIESPS